MQTLRLDSAAASAAGAKRAGAPERLARGKVVVDAAQAPAGAPAGAPARAPLKRGVAGLDQQLQGDIAGAQQALAYLDQSASQLQALKSALAARLASRQGGSGQVDIGLRQFGATWQARAQASGGTLNAQLEYSSPGAASQRFRIDGLDIASLRAGAPALVAFSNAGANREVQSVSIEAGLSEQEIAQRFARALAPLNLGVSIAPSGALLLSTPEANWPAQRDSLQVKASGIELPEAGAGRPVIREEPAAIAPHAWSAADTDALRGTLQQVVQALAQVQHARQMVGRALDMAANRVASAQPAGTSAGVQRMADNFVAAASEPGYAALLSVTSALTGIDRDRVLALLAMR